MSHYGWVAYAIPAAILTVLTTGSLWDGTSRWRRARAWRRAQAAQHYQPAGLEITGVFPPTDFQKWENELDRMPGIDMHDGERWPQ